MADLHEARRQQVQAQAADELVAAQPQGLLAGAVGVILVGERHRAGGVVDGAHAIVGEPDAVRIAREIGEHGLRPGEGRFT